MSEFQLVVVAGLVVAIVPALLVTQSKDPVSWPAWRVPLALVVPLTAWTVLAIAEEGLLAFLAVQGRSLWRVQVSYNLSMSVTAALFLLQNRARAADMKSEVWMLAIIFTASIGLFLMLARMLYLERRLAAGEASAAARVGPPHRGA